MHLKRNKVPKNWPITRKGSTFVIRPAGNIKEGVPILVFLRDMLRIVQNRREAKKAIYEKKILINQKPVIDEKQTVLFNDRLTIVPAKKTYKLGISRRGKFEALEISPTEAKFKVSKVINKKILKGKKVQINLNDGKNFISDLKCNVNDSVLIDLEKRKIDRVIPLKEKAKAVIYAGKHSGKQGIIERILGEKKSVIVRTEDGEINILIKQMMVTE